MFDPMRHGFGFRNPVGKEDSSLASLVFGRGLCFGMAVGSLVGYRSDREIAAMSETTKLTSRLKQLHVSQFRPVAVAMVVSEWLSGRGVSPEDIELPDDSDPHILCFGPARSRRFFANFGRSHAVVPYRIERSADETRVYVYDPNFPKRRDRYVVFDEDGFRYGGFSSDSGFGLFLLPFSVVSPNL